MNLPPRGETLKAVFDSLNEHVEDTGYGTASAEVGVSVDTMRRRVRGSQPWAFEEVFDLARHELSKGRYATIAHAIAKALSPSNRDACHPLMVPSNLREMLRVVGRITTEIADTLEDGRVDTTEARSLLQLLAELEQLTAGLRIDLAALARDR
ncbi:MAG: hypothetical protein PF961_13190 [Planctomycetota bacterium]|jgi:hypothetical protein|nr:hypothetical protein [Planctomycetota bacterium]